MIYLEYLFLLLCGHALADYGLQTYWMSCNKGNQWALVNHCLIHSLMVYLITNSLLLASMELGFHYVIDTLKWYKVINFNVDQTLHCICKILYLVLL